MIKEDIFSHAVTLAAGFIANGDIRCRKFTEDDKDILKVSDLISALYAAVNGAREQVDLRESQRKDLDA